MTDYIAPEFDLDGFNCPSCGAFAHQTWRLSIQASIQDSTVGIYSTIGLSSLLVATCSKCEKHSYWLSNEMIFPSKSVAPLPSLDMPEDVAKDYNEARSIFEKSPKSAAALY